ncbi:MAG: dual specificity protein phosphatase family protein [Polyangiaceae bacterium]|nr:dual specificity protein phosphatase family protein [Myxococcales bacterium]MCB9585331.1 dual specificity protein phosphatase family protein [Polyangiaceae bacterium]MCB9606653.1 dual specificity protein phosphatase family protein [Polyangiaceae bacterium]
MTDTPVFEIVDGGLCGPESNLFSGLSWKVEAGRVTALIGPAGVGKSLILRSLAGALPSDWQRKGRWSYAGADTPPTDDLFWLRQLPRGNSQPWDVDDLIKQISAHRVAFLDEPERCLERSQLQELGNALRSYTGTTILVTHDVAFAHEFSHRVALLCAGRLFADDTTACVFENPPNELTARFIRDGNCWPRPEAEAPPSHFKWVIPGALAGMGKPGLLAPLEDELAAIAMAGISMLLTLTNESFSPSELSPFGLEARHFPIEDMGIPTVSNAIRLCRTIEKALERGDRVAVHCHAGLGRTGSMLAAYLIYKGSTAEEAIAKVREVRPGYIQSQAQLDFLTRFEVDCR